MATFDRTYEIGGSRYRIVIVGDVIAAPYQGWSDGGYGVSVCKRWLEDRFTSGFPIPALKQNKVVRAALAEAIVQAMIDRGSK
tara:strand:+ start:127 stop:375 length:249 start_codon:yes stop_codon:yes gene_type:complete